MTAAFIPQHDDDFPTLGWTAIDWMTENLAHPDGVGSRTFELYAEQEDFLLEWYRLDPITGRRLYWRGVLSRPRGWGKSPFVAGMMALEGIAPIRFDGWDASGQPVGAPWHRFRVPHIAVAAVSEEQARNNTWSALLNMLEGPVAYNYPRLDAMGTMVGLPDGKGFIKPVGTSGPSVKGLRAVFAALDQTEEWVRGNGGIDMYEKMSSNAAKVGGTLLETPNAFIPGKDSVAERSAKAWQATQAGNTRLKTGVYWSHREAAGSTDMTNDESLTAGLRLAYGDSSKHPDGCVIHDPACPPGHVDLDALKMKIWDPTSDPQEARSDFLNQITHASDSWLSQPEVRAIARPNIVVEHGEQIVIGFDGSRGRVKGKADATALIGCRVSDGHMFVLGIWEQPMGVDAKDWAPPLLEIQQTVNQAFSDYTVAAFYADPSGWTTQVAEWEAEHGRSLAVKVNLNNPMSAWPKGKDSRVPELVEQVRNAIANTELTYDGNPALTAHLLNARRRSTRGGYLLYKSFPDSPDKIDAAYATLLAFKARNDVIARGKARSGPRRRVKVVVM